jgi:hypothetical protein
MTLVVCIRRGGRRRRAPGLILDGGLETRELVTLGDRSRGAPGQGVYGYLRWERLNFGLSVELQMISNEGIAGS